MFPLTTMAGGTCQAFPDVCMVPALVPVPVPFTNTGMCAMANALTCSQKVKVVNMPAITVMSMLPSTMGDEGGTYGGVTSGTITGPLTFKMGVMKVKIEGNDAVNMLKPTAHNGASANAPSGMIVAPSQLKVILNG